MRVEGRRIRVYIAGPYSKPDPCENTHVAVGFWNRLWDMGYAPFCPHLTHFIHTMKPRPYADWIAYDNEWVRACDVLFRFKGESPGADAEVELARRHGIPVVHSLGELEMWSKEGVTWPTID